jgi:hypothetical protein
MAKSNYSKIPGAYLSSLYLAVPGVFKRAYDGHRVPFAASVRMSCNMRLRPCQRQDVSAMAEIMTNCNVDAPLSQNLTKDIFNH